MEEPEGALGSQFSDWQQLADAYARKIGDRLRGEPVDQAELERLAAALEKARQAYANDHPTARGPRKP